MKPFILPLLAAVLVALKMSGVWPGLTWLWALSPLWLGYLLVLAIVWICYGLATWLFYLSAKAEITQRRRK